MVTTKLKKKTLSFYSELVRGPLIYLFLSFFPQHGFSESFSWSFRLRSSFSTIGFVHIEGAERSRLRYPTEPLCGGALPGHILTLLASFHTVTTQCLPHSHGKVKTPPAHVWVSTDSVCEELQKDGYTEDVCSSEEAVKEGETRWCEAQMFSCIYTVF